MVRSAQRSTPVANRVAGSCAFARSTQRSSGSTATGLVAPPDRSDDRRAPRNDQRLSQGGIAIWQDLVDGAGFTGRYPRMRRFAFTLGYSHQSVWRLAWHSSCQGWAALHEETFRRLGGGLWGGWNNGHFDAVGVAHTAGTRHDTARGRCICTTRLRVHAPRAPAR